jgi:Domain of unknown function (DUF4055)
MSVTTPHPAYEALLPLWEDLRTAYIGEVAVKTAMPRTRVGTRSWPQPGMRYLGRPAGMKRAEQYAVYLGNASWTPATERAVQGITGSVFRHAPQIAAPTALERQIADITQTGVSLRMFSEQVTLETLLMGRYGLLVDYPAPTTLPDGTELAPSPTSPHYWVGYAAEEILNWRTVQREGKTLLSLVVCKEVVEDVQGPWGTPDFFVVKPRTQYRVLRLDAAGEYEVSLWSEVQDVRGQQPGAIIMERAWKPTRQGAPLTFIPFVFLGPFSLEPTIQKSLMEGLVYRNFVNFRHSAECEWARFLTAMPTLYLFANMEEPPELLVGSAQGIFSQDNQAKCGLVEFHGHGLGPLENALKEDLAMMAALGARLLEGPPTTQETATGVNWRMAGSDSPIQSLISVVSQGLTWALQTHAWWAGVTENVDDPAIHVHLNTDLVSTTMQPQMLTALMTALLNGTISQEMYYYNLQQGEVAIPGVSFEEEQALLEAQLAQQPLVAPSQAPPPAGQNGAARQAA